MRKTDKKIISLFLLLIMIIAQLSPVFAADYATGEEIESETYETLGDYLEVYYPNKSFETFTELTINHGAKDITIKDMSQLTELKNLTELEIWGGFFEKIYVTGLTKLNKLKICDVANPNYVSNQYNNYYGERYAQLIGVNTLLNLTELNIWNVRTETLDISNMPKLKVLQLSSVRNMEGTGNLIVSNLNNATSIIVLGIDSIECSNINLSKLTNLKILSLGQLDATKTYTVEEFGLNDLTNIKSFYYDGSYELIGTLSFPKADIRSIRICPSVSANFPNFVVDIRGKDLQNFEFSYYIGSIYGKDFELERNILADDYSLISFTSNDAQRKESYSFSRDYNTVSEFVDLNSEYYLLAKEEITELKLYHYNIKDYSDLITYNNLENLYLYNLNLKDINFNLPSKLEGIGINHCSLNGKLDFKKCNNLREINIMNLQGDLTNAVIDIEGMYWLRHFELDFSSSDAYGFKSDNILTTDEYGNIEYQEYEHEDNSKSIYYRYYGNYYNTIEEYIEENYDYENLNDITSLDISGVNIQDYSGLSKLSNITYIRFYNMKLGNMDFTKLLSENSKKIEQITMNECQLTGNLNFSNCDSLKVINMSEVTGDMSNITIDIRGLEYLSNFSFDANTVSNFELEKNILADTYFYRRVYISEENEYQVFRTVYKDIDEYLAENYPEEKKDEMTFLSIWATILDYSGLSQLNSLEELYINNSDLNNINFGILPNLKSIHISNSNLNGILDFRNNTKLKSIDITGEGDLSNTVIDIRRYGMAKLF